MRASSPLRTLLIPGLLLPALAFSACAGEAEPPNEGAEEEVVSPDQEAWEGEVREVARLLRPKEGTPEDWELFQKKVEWAWEWGLDSLPLGETMVRIGASFIGTPYAPGTLELADPEEVVVNLQQLDCVTFVENVFALARFIRVADRQILESGEDARELYRGLLQEMRYRNGRLEGYASRLHYFSEWIADNESRGLVRELTAELGGEEDTEAVDFMSAHPEAYRQLTNPLNLEAVVGVEVGLASVPRYRVPQEDIESVSSQIQNGDIIAATSTVEGLDVAHTGLAFWLGGSLRLLHAPQAGYAVQVSRLPLAERVLRAGGQDGIQVARPRPPNPRNDTGSGS
jgi:hypothetical protein